MGLAVLIEHGVRALRGTAAQVSSLEARIGVEHTDAALEALDHLAPLLHGLNELAWSDNASPRARTVLTVVMSYGLLTDDLIPARGDNLLFAVLDDAYLAYFAAQQVSDPIPDVDARAIVKGRDALARVLPPDVVAELERRLLGALDEIETFEKGS